MITIDRLCVRLPGFALQGISLRVGDAEYLTLVGPYASGKTLLLETIAGLHRVTSGKIWLDDRDITGLEPEKRGISMVYQDCGLFPHLSVAENIAFGLRVRRRPAPEIKRELDRAVELFGIRDLLPRIPGNLSGGEKQKVALARALVTDPQVLLLDEPLAALDPESRERVRLEISRLHRELGIAIIHVTHDFEEAVMMGTRIAVIGEGSIRQVGTPDEVFRHPNSEFVARFTMATNILSGAAFKENGRTVFSAEGISLVTESDITGRCMAAIRPESILISRSQEEDHTVNVFPAVITGIVNKGSVVNVSAGRPVSLTCLLTRHTFEQMALAEGQQVYLTIPPSSVALFRG